MAWAKDIRTVLIDLDDCLYDIKPFPGQMAANIQRYMEHKLDFPGHNISAVCADLYLGHGTTLAGLVSRGYRIDYDDWHAHAHGVLPYELVQRDPKLREILHSLPLPKWVFTNADTKHAEICLERLGVRDCFEGVICFESTMAAAEAAGIVRDGAPVVCKPSPLAIKLALQAAGCADPEATLFCDDSTRNIGAGKALGLRTVLVDRKGYEATAAQQVSTGASVARGDAHLVVRSLHELPVLLPDLFLHPVGIRSPTASNGLTENGNGAVQNILASQQQPQQNGSTAAAGNGVQGGDHADMDAGDAAADSEVRHRAAEASALEAGSANGNRMSQPLPSPTCRQQQLLSEQPQAQTETR